MTVRFDVPSTIRRFDETVCCGNIGMVKDFVVALRIDSVQAARHRLFRQSRGSSAEDEGCSQSNLDLGQHFLNHPPVGCRLRLAVAHRGPYRRRYIAPPALAVAAFTSRV